jgi:hypothetical protein
VPGDTLTLRVEVTETKSLCPFLFHRDCTPPLRQLHSRTNESTMKHKKSPICKLMAIIRCQPSRVLEEVIVKWLEVRTRASQVVPS